MQHTRRQFIATSTAALWAGAFWRLDALGQQAQATIEPVFREIRHNAGFWTARGGTIGWLINPAGVRRDRVVVTGG